MLAQGWEPVWVQGEPQQPFDPDPADAAGAVLQPAQAATVRGLVLETASVKVLVLALVRDWAQGWARGQLEWNPSPPFAGPLGGHRPHGPKPEPLLHHLLQELETAPALLRREHQSLPALFPASAQVWASAQASETLQPVVRTS